MTSPAGRIRLLSLTAFDHVHHAQLPREQLVGIDIDHRLAVLAAEHGGDFGAFHHRDLVADLELGQIVKLSFVQTFALHRDQTNRQAGGVELQHQRRQRAGRQALQVGQGQIGQLRHVGIGVGAGLEIYLDDADAQQRAGLHVIDPLAWVKKRSSGLVISTSMSCGGMPL